VLIFGLCWFGLTGTAIAFVSTFGAALALRALQGIGFAALTPIIITSLGDLYAGTKEATAQGLRFTGSGLSQTAFPLAAGVLVGVAWQYPFLLYAVAFPIAAVVYVYFEEPLDEAPDEESEAGIREQLDDMRTLVAHRRAWAMVAARGTANIAWFGFLTYNSILVVNVPGYTPTEAGIPRRGASLTPHVRARGVAGRAASRPLRRPALPARRDEPVDGRRSRAHFPRPVARGRRRRRRVHGSRVRARALHLPERHHDAPARGPARRTRQPRRGGGARGGDGNSGCHGCCRRGRDLRTGSRPRFARWEWGTGVVSAGVGIACLLLMSTSPPIRMGE